MLKRVFLPIICAFIFLSANAQKPDRLMNWTKDSTTLSATSSTFDLKGYLSGNINIAVTNNTDTTSYATLWLSDDGSSWTQYSSDSLKLNQTTYDDFHILIEGKAKRYYRVKIRSGLNQTGNFKAWGNKVDPIFKY